MILTITMNPSVDIGYQLSQPFQLDAVNRVSTVNKTAGGKGLNVTRVLKQFQTPVLASGLLGGVLGEFIKADLTNQQIKHEFFTIAEETRNCLAIIHDNQQTEILEAGPMINEDEATKFLEHVNKLLDQITIVAISGSLPRGLNTTYYVKLLKICADKQIPVILDTSGTALQEVLTSPIKPKLIKPNLEELAYLLNQPLSNDEATIQKALTHPMFNGIEWIIVSRGASGAIAKHNDKMYSVSIPKVAAVNPVGSGDSMIAGLVSGLHDNLTDTELLARGCTLGVLNALEEKTGTINLAHYDTIHQQVTIANLGGTSHDIN